VVARAQKAEVAKQASTAAAAVALASVISFGAVDAAYADVAGLTPCSESKAFDKLRKTEVKKLEKRKQQVCCPRAMHRHPDTRGQLRLQIISRFYSGRLCFVKQMLHALLPTLPPWVAPPDPSSGRSDNAGHPTLSSVLSHRVLQRTCSGR
jgi:Photosystem I reaction centre subunit III